MLVQAPAIPYSISFQGLLREYATTVGRLFADERVKELVNLCTQFRPKLIDGLLQEVLLEEMLILTQEGIYGADTVLNEVSRLVLDVVLADTKGSYTAALYDHFAGKERPNIFIRPILGDQLAKVRTWIELLKDPSLPEDLRALQRAVEEAVAVADEAISQKEKAQEERSRFWKIGQKRQLIDAFNQHRQELFEKLKALATDSPEEYARSFFAERRVEARIEGEAQVKSLKERLAQNEAEGASLRAQLLAAEAEVEKQRRNEEELETARVALAQGEKAAAEAKKRVQELKAKLGKK